MRLRTVEWDRGISAPWPSRWLAHPATGVILQTWLVISAPYAILSFGKALLPTTKLAHAIWPLLASAIATAVSLALFILGRTLDALRFWATLPASRWSLAGTLLLLPFLALLPLAWILFFALDLSLLIYFVFAACWLVVTGSALRWGRMGGAIAFNVVGMVLGFWPLLHYASSESASMIDRIGLTVTVLGALTASVWIVHLLRTRAEPFRYHLTTFGGMMGY